MTIIRQDRLNVPITGSVSFATLRTEVKAAESRDLEYSSMNEEKKRLLRTGVNYQEFKDLVSTVGLKPITRTARAHANVAEVDIPG